MYPLFIYQLNIEDYYKARKTPIPALKTVLLIIRLYLPLLILSQTNEAIFMNKRTHLYSLLKNLSSILFYC